MGTGTTSDDSRSTGWQEIHRFLRSRIGTKAAHPSNAQTTGGAHAATSNHFKGLAVDYGDANSDCHAVVAALLPFAKAAVLTELFFAPTDTWWKNGHKLTAAAVGGHQDHVHVAIRAGARLPDDTEEDELNAEESKALSRIDQRVENLQSAIADMHPEVPDAVGRLEQKVASLEQKVDRLLDKVSG